MAWYDRIMDFFGWTEEKAKDIFGPIIDRLKAWTGTKIGNMIEYATWYGGKIYEFVKGKISDMIRWSTWVGGEIYGFVAGKIADVKEWARNNVEKVTRYVTNKFYNTYKTVKNVTEKVYKTVKNVTEKTVKNITNVTKNIKNVTKNIVNKTIKNITNVTKNIKNVSRNVVNKTVGFFREDLVRAIQPKGFLFNLVAKYYRDILNLFADLTGESPSIRRQRERAAARTMIERKTPDVYEERVNLRKLRMGMR